MVLVRIMWRRPRHEEDDPPAWFTQQLGGADELLCQLPGIPRVGEKVRLGPVGGKLEETNVAEVHSVLWDVADGSVRLRVR